MDGGSPAATSSLAATWPLVGREAELTRIAEAMGDEDCRGVVVSAGAGVGKSRLAREAHAAAQRSGALAVWAQATRVAAIGAMPDAVDAAAQAAAALVRAGRHDAARRAAVRMRELHVPGQGTEPPEIEGLDAAASTLTSRESEIVTLAAGGLSNAEIADRLVLSVRTVESHIYRAMHKLGVSDRRDL